MRTRTTLTAAALLAAGALLGWLTASGRLTTALAQEKPKADTPPAAGTPSVLPRPDFHFPGNVGRTFLDSDLWRPLAAVCATPSLLSVN